MSCSISFKSVSLLLHKLNLINNSGRYTGKRKFQLLSECLKSWLKEFLPLNCTSQLVFNLYRLLLPQEDVSRKYYLKEQKLADYIQSILGIRYGRLGEMVKNWRTDACSKNSGDLSAIIGEAVDQLAIAETDNNIINAFSIARVNQLLDELVPSVGYNLLAQGIRSGSTRKPIEVLTDLYLGRNGMEAKWLTRIILKDLHLNIDNRVFFDAFHSMFSSAFLLENNLKSACDTISNIINAGYLDPLTSERYFEAKEKFMSVKVGSNIGIMQCGKCIGFEDAYNKLKGSMAFVETKYDGERVQAHFSYPDTLRIFSKSKRDSTSDRQKCHRILKAAIGHDDDFLRDLNVTPMSRTSPIESIILEAELLVYNEACQTIEPFGSIREFLPDKEYYNNEIMNGTRHLMLIFFDVLFLNGKALLNTPLFERRRILDNIIQVIPNYSLLTWKTNLDCNLPKDQVIAKLSEIYNEHEAKMEEGLILKLADSKYFPMSRRFWFKLKRDYIEGLGDCLDFCIVGASYGSYKSASQLNTFFAACLSNRESVERGTEKPNFMILFSVEAGLSEAERLRITQNERENLVPYSEWNNGTMKRPFSFISLAGSKIDVLFKEPLVFELLCSGFTCQESSSNQDNRLFVMRFPRICKVYYDSNILQGISFQEFQELAESTTKTLERQRKRKAPESAEEMIEFEIADQNLKDSLLPKLQACQEKFQLLPDGVSKIVFVNLEESELVKRVIKRFRGIQTAIYIFEYQLLMRLEHPEIPFDPSSVFDEFLVWQSPAT